MKPLLLLDVDGVVNVPGAPETHVVRLPSLSVVVSFPDGIRGRLARLDAAYEVMWLTSWGRYAPERLGPLLNFDWPCAWDPRPGETQEAKVEVVVAQAGRHRPFAWVDDLTFPGIRPWLARRPGPWMLPKVDPGVGLDDALAEALARWADALDTLHR